MNSAASTGRTHGSSDQHCDIVQKNPCQHGAVHTWHITDISPVGLDFRFWGYNGHQNRGSRLPLLTQVVSERQLTILVRIPRAAYDCDALAARCANTIATPPRVAAEANNKRSVISSESMTTPPKAAIGGTES